MSIDRADKIQKATFVRLKAGGSEAPLFLLPGIMADPILDFAKVATHARTSRPIIGIEFCQRDVYGQLPTTVAAMANSSYLAIREFQPRGPYYIVGYSFGGLVAIEVARLLRSECEIVHLALIDTRYDRRYWPMGVFMRSQVRLIGLHLKRLTREPPQLALKRLTYLVQRLVTLLLERHTSWSIDIHTLAELPASDFQKSCSIANSRYHPVSYPGRIALFLADDHGNYCSDPYELWRDFIKEIKCQIFHGNHLSILRSDAAAAKMAIALERFGAEEEQNR